MNKLSSFPSRFINFLASKYGIILSGSLIGLAAVILQKFGNPANMGFCIACFTRDIAGALGLHRVAVVQYIRPEIIGIVLGATITSLLTKKFMPRGGSAPLVHFLLGAFAMIGALVFLGCTWRLFLRLAGGDGNALFGLAGLVAGVYAATLFIKRGYDLGQINKQSFSVGILFPLIIFALLLLMLFFPAGKSAMVFYSQKGPGAQHAPWLLSLAFGLGVGFVAQRSSFCTTGAFGKLFLFKSWHMLAGVIALAVTAFVLNLFFGQFNPGFASQPIAHTSFLWNFLGMLLAGLAFTLGGGCPGRQLVRAGEGDVDAAIFSLGMLVGAAFSHNFLIAASPAGINTYSAVAVFTGLAFTAWLGFSMRG
jgi:YedE family putative selenium metabolism protein